MHLHWKQRTISKLPSFLQPSKRLSSGIATDDFKWVHYKSQNSLVLTSSKSPSATTFLKIANKGLQNVLGRSSICNFSRLMNILSKGWTNNYFNSRWNKSTAANIVWIVWKRDLAKGIIIDTFWIYFNVHIQPRFQAVTIVPIEANYFNNLQINKQFLLRQLKIKLENMQFVGMTQRSRRRRLT